MNDCERCGTPLPVGGAGCDRCEAPLATLPTLEPISPATPTAAEGSQIVGISEGHMIVEASATGAPARSPFDSGSTPRKKIVGWLMTFSINPSGQAYRLTEGTNTLGSDPRCDLVIPNEPSIGRRHATITARNGKLAIQEDHGSRGVTLNGVNIAGRGAPSLKNLDRLRIGLIEFRVYTTT
jgi:hypothetical protein